MGIRYTPTQALLRLAGCMAATWLFMEFTPAAWYLTWFLPVSFFLLMGLVVFGIVGLDWPFGAPGGSWAPGKSRVGVGIGMLLVWVLFALVLAGIERYVWPKMPLDPGGVFFGIGVFGTTLWWAFDGAGPHLFKKPLANIGFATVGILAVAAILFSVFVSFQGTPLAGASFDPGGKYAGGYWFGLMVWVIVWIQVFGGPMALQGWPFYKLGRVLHPIALTVFVIIAGYASWRFGLEVLKVSPTFWFGAVGASIIGWTLMHSVCFEMYPFARFIQPLRGVLNVVLEIAVSAVWILLLRVILAPVLNHLGGPKPGLDINLVSAWFTLHGTAIVLLIHHFFFLRAPYTVAGPPLGPEEVPPEPESVSVVVPGPGVMTHPEPAPSEI